MIESVLLSIADLLDSMLHGGLITIYVGAKRKRFQVHKKLLASHNYWAKKVSGTVRSLWRQSDDPAFWDLFVNWLYRGNIKEISWDDEGKAQVQARLYVVLSLTAATWGIRELQNMVMDRLRERTTCELGWFPRSVIRRIYQTGEKSPLRSYAVDSFISKSYLWNAGERMEVLRSHLDYENNCFVIECFDAASRAASRYKIRDPDKKVGCHYHQHEDGKNCMA